MSDVKSKKIDVRLSIDVYEQLSLISYTMNVSRSELLRLMIDHFMESGVVDLAGQKMSWGESLQYSQSKFEAENRSVEDLYKPRSNKEPITLSPNLDDKLKREVEMFINNTVKIVREEIEESEEK